MPNFATSAGIPSGHGLLCGLKRSKLQKDDDELIVHWGTVGDVGEHTIHSLKGKHVDTLLSELALNARRLGFVEIHPDQYRDIIINYPVIGFGTKDDLSKRHEIESVLDYTLGWFGNGHCSGGEIGSGSMSVFCQVLDREKAIEVITTQLIKNNLFDGTTIEDE